MNKRFFAIILCLFLPVALFLACEKKNEEELTVTIDDTEEPDDEIEFNVSVPNAPMALPIAVIMEKNLLGDNVKINTTNWDMTEELVAMVESGDYDGFAFPLTAGANLYNKGADIKLLNIDLWGISYLVTTDKNFTSWENLKGKKLYLPAEGSPPTVMAKYFIQKAGLDLDKDPEFVYASIPEVAGFIISGEAEYAVLNEPQVTAATMKNEEARIALSFEDEYKRVNGNDNIIPTAGFGMKSEYINEHPKFVEDFQNAFKEAIEWINSNPGEAGEIAEKALGLKASLIQKSIPTMGLKFKSAKDSKEDLKQYYTLIMELNPKMIGNKIPDEGMLY